MRENGEVVSRDWDVVLPAVQRALSTAVKGTGTGLKGSTGGQRGPQQIAAILSPWMTVEEAYLLAGYMKSLSPKATLGLGPVRVIGEDDAYPKDVHGRPLQYVKFTIHAEKCPNRRGVEMILKHFVGTVVPFGDVLGRAAGGDFAAVYLVGGDPAGWIDEKQAAALEATPIVVVQDILPSAAGLRANFVLAGGSFAERDGTFINHAGLAQQIRRAIRGPGKARPDGRILWELAGRRGLFNAAALRREIAREVPALSPLGAGELGDEGVFVTIDG